MSICFSGRLLFHDYEGLSHSSSVGSHHSQINIGKPIVCTDGHVFEGRIDELIFWSSVLTDSQVFDVFGSGNNTSTT